ncbi:MAG: hypothetical protein ACTHKU_17035, partial [Verrucomicrobiota bacterium]
KTIDYYGTSTQRGFFRKLDFLKLDFEQASVPTLISQFISRDVKMPSSTGVQVRRSSYSSACAVPAVQWID